ncbi:MAG: glycosyltransferase [Thermaurantimonas sp.]
MHIHLPSENFIIFGQQPWDTPIGSNCKNIALELSKNFRVIYINIPLDRFTILRNASGDQKHIEYRRQVNKGHISPFLEINDRLTTFTPRTVLESINWLPDGSVFDFFNYINNRRQAREVQYALGELNIKDFILFNDSDMFRSFYMQEMLSPIFSIYYSRDNLISTDYFKRHGTRLEPRLIAKSDMAAANSIYLKNYCARFNPNSYYIGQGCELDLFDPDKDFEKPEELKKISGPIIGYIGALLKMRLDLNLLENLAVARPEWQFVFVGPEDEHFKTSPLHHLSNVHFLGPRKPEQLPTYLKFFDVAINPQEVNPMTIGNYPRKIDEYLAMGKPVVATRTEAMQAFEGFVYLASSVGEYQQFIEKALSEKDDIALRKKRIEHARSHSWENSVQAMLLGIEDTISKKVSA